MTNDIDYRERTWAIFFLLIGIWNLLPAAGFPSIDGGGNSVLLDTIVGAVDLVMAAWCYRNYRKQFSDVA